MILLDISPSPGGVAVFSAVAFLLIFLAIAFIVFKLLKRTVKTAFRVVIVAVMVAIAISGSAFFLMLGKSKPVRPTPRAVQPK